MEYSFSKDKSPVLLHNPPTVFGSGDCVFRFDFLMCIENEKKIVILKLDILNFVQTVTILV